MPLTEYQRYSQVSRSSSNRSPFAAIGAPLGSSATTSSTASAPSGTASAPAGERSPIASGRCRIGRLEDADPDRRRQRAGQVRQIVQGNRQLGLAVLAGRRRLDVAPVGRELFVDQTKLEVGVVR